MHRRAAMGALACALLPGPAAAQEAPVGPCSPYRAADGDIPSEMPGCGRRARPAPGSLADEVEFARGRRDGADRAPDGADEEATPPRRRSHRPRE